MERDEVGHRPQDPRRRGCLGRLVILAITLVAIGSTAGLLVLGRTLNQEEPGALRRIVRSLGHPLVSEVVEAPATVPTGPRATPEGKDKTTEAALVEALRAAGSGHRVVRFDNPPLRESRFHFTYQDLSDPALKALRDRLALDEIEPPGPQPEDELRFMLAVSGQIRGLAAHADDFPEQPPGEAADVLLDHVAGGGSLYCHTYSLLFVQSMLALGYEARLIAASSSGEAPTHGVAEVWSNAFGRWVLVDTDYNMLYTVEGQPQSVYEISRVAYDLRRAYQRHLWANDLEDTLQHNEAYHGRDRTFFEFVRAHSSFYDQVEVMRGPNKTPRIDTFLRENSPTQRCIEQYHAFAIPMRNDFLSRHYPIGHEARGLALSPPMDATGRWFILNDVVPTDRLSDMYWTLNGAEVGFEGLPGAGLKLSMSTITPSFDHFEVTLNGQVIYSGPKGEFTVASALLGAPKIRVTVQAVNALGVKGYPTIFELASPDAAPEGGAGGEVEVPSAPGVEAGVEAGAEADAGLGEAVEPAATEDAADDNAADDNAVEAGDRAEDRPEW